MDAQGKRTLKIGITVGLSLGAIVGLVGCGEEMAADESTSTHAAAESENGLSGNGLSANGLSLNGLSLNGLSLNGLSGNGLSGNGLMTTSGGRDVVKYIAKCALPSNQSLIYQDQYGTNYTYPGLLGVAPEWQTGACDYNCQERVSACMLAHVNNSGYHIAIWLDSESNIGWGKSPNYPYEEGSFFGNLFPVNNTWRGYFCLGTDYDQGSVPGRLGATIPNTSVYVNAWPGGNCPLTNSGSQPALNTCVRHSDGSGMDNCTNGINGANNTWKHVVTVWRNFDANTVYQLCGWSSGTCLASSGSGAGAAVKSMSSNKYDTTQQWWVIQVNPGQYKFVNVATGMAMDVNSSKMLVTNSYTGASSQLNSISTLGGSQVGRFGVAASSVSGYVYNMTNSGTQAALTNNGNMDSAKLVLTGVASLTYGGSSTDGAQYNFEGSSQGWTVISAPATAVANSGVSTYAGAQSLAVTSNGNAGTAQVQVYNPSTPAGKVITYHFYIPSGAPISSVQPFIQQSGSYTWTGTWTSVGSLNVGGWNTLSVTVPSNATALYSLGMQYTTSTTWSGTVYIDSISW
jgi:hypothetical protein